MKKTVNTQPHYVGNKSLYFYAEKLGLNAYEFDMLKRVIRCRHKGKFAEDLEKTKDLLTIYKKEFDFKPAYRSISDGMLTELIADYQLNSHESYIAKLIVMFRVDFVQSFFVIENAVNEYLKEVSE